MRRRLAVLAVGCTALSGAAEPNAVDRILLDAMRTELARTSKDLRLPEAPAPYYVGYWVVDREDHDVQATLGAILSDQTTRDRFAKVDLRVGSRMMDNSSFGASPGLDGDLLLDAQLSAPRPVPLDDDALAVQRELWLATDSAYKLAVETLEKKRAARRTKVDGADEPASFSDDRSATIVVPDLPPAPKSDPTELARSVSAVFRAYPEVQTSNVHVLVTSVRRRFVSSDGGLVVEPARFEGLEVSGGTQAPDGMALERSAFVAAERGKGIPKEAATREATRIAKELTELRAAPIVEDYAGPVLFEGRAAAQLAHDLLGEAVSGTPAPDGDEDFGTSLSRRLGKRVLPKGFSVVDDPTVDAFEGAPLLGHYAVDDEGIAAERVSLVEDGTLRALLMSRTPREGIARSNGHGRSGLVGWARGRPANLIVQAKDGLSKRALRARLLDAVRDEGAEFGLVVTELDPRSGSSGGTVLPAPQMAYRVALDGKETLVRGATLAPLPLRALRSILAAGRERTVWSFVAEGDGVDTGVSIVSPSLLFEDVEIRRPKAPQQRPPVVARPVVER